jgi:hypothetical protein
MELLPFELVFETVLTRVRKNVRDSRCSIPLADVEERDGYVCETVPGNGAAPSVLEADFGMFGRRNKWSSG